MKKLVFIAFMTLFAVSCSKEKQISNKLWKRGGEWKISTYKYEYRVLDENDTTMNIWDNDHDCGTFYFHQDGTGTQILKLGYETTVTNFEYVVTKDEVTFNYEGGEHRTFKSSLEEDRLLLYFSGDGMSPSNYPVKIDQSFQLNKL